MTEPDFSLFPVSRDSDPATSKIAEAMIHAKRPTQMLLILHCYLRGDLTDEQASDEAQIRHGWKRCADLRNAGLIEPTGRTIIGKAGTPVMVCKITRYGRWVIENSEADWTQGPVRKRRVAVADGTQEVGAQDQPALSRAQTADLEARVALADWTIAAEINEAYEAGESQGWERGYNEGIDAAQKRPGALLEAKHEGMLLGRKQQAQRTINLITQMRDQMKGKGPVEAHPIGCYVRHPACALDSVRKAQEVK